MATSLLQDVCVHRTPIARSAERKTKVQGQVERLPWELRMFLLATVGLGLLCAAAELICAFVLGKHGVYTWPTLPFYDCLDFRCFLPRFSHFHQHDFFSDAPSRGLAFGYPAAGAVMYQCFYAVRWHPLLYFFVITLSGVGALLWFLGCRMREQHLPRRTILLFLATAMVFSYPLWFEYLLGNMEICIFLLVAAGIVVFLRGRGYAAAVCFALAGSVKLFPLIYLGLLLSRRQYRQFAFGLLLPAPVTLFSLWLVCPSIAVAQRGISAGLRRFTQEYLLAYRPMESGFDHSLFGLVKRWYPFESTQELQAAMFVYIAVVAIAGTLLYFVVIRNLPLTNQVLCLAISSLLLPTLSHDYTLLQLYVPWAMLVVLALRAARMGRMIPGLRAAFVAFAILFAPQTEFIVAGETLNGPIKAFVLIGLMAVGLRFRFSLRDAVHLPRLQDASGELVVAS